MLDIMMKIAMLFLIDSNLYNIPEGSPAPTLIMFEDDEVFMSYYCTNNILHVDTDTVEQSTDFELQVLLIHEFTHWAQCMSGYSGGKQMCVLEQEAYDVSTKYAAEFGIDLTWKNITDTVDCAVNDVVYKDSWLWENRRLGP